LPGLDVRLGLTDEILKSVLPKPERKSGGHPHPNVIRWDSIRKEISQLLSVRRRIAHQPINASVWEFTLADNTPQIQVSGFEIYASVHERLRKSGSIYPDDYDVPPLTDTDLVAHLVSLEKARHELLNFRHSAQPKPPAIQPPIGPLTIQGKSEAGD